MILKTILIGLIIAGLLLIPTVILNVGQAAILVALGDRPMIGLFLALLIGAPISLFLLGLAARYAVGRVR